MKQTNKTVDLNAAPSKQFNSSLFHQAIGSIPVAILFAIGATWLAYTVLPETVAGQYVPQIWIACLGSGVISSVKSASDLSERGKMLTASLLGKKGTEKAAETTEAQSNEGAEQNTAG